jgi:hypothetical protein
MEKNENDRGKDGSKRKEKKERKNYVIIIEKIESWEQKRNVMLNKSKLKERKGERIVDDLRNEERKT